MSAFSAVVAGRGVKRRLRPALGAASLLIALATSWFGAALPASAATFSPARPIRVAPEADYGPFVFSAEDGRPQGLSIDFLQLIEKKTGLVMAMSAAQSLNVNLELAKRREVDLITSLRPTPERAAYLAFTSPYILVPAILVVRADSAAVTLESLTHRPVAVGKGYAVEHFVRERYPDVTWVAVADDAEALRRLRAGTVAAVVADQASVAFVSRRQRWFDLRALGPVGFDYALCFAYRSDWPELGILLQQSLHQITAAERSAVLARWMPPLERATPMSIAGPALLAAALFAAALCAAALARYRRRREGA
jgi:ABC-type amino acid transport substrate-binding protein